MSRFYRTRSDKVACVDLITGVFSYRLIEEHVACNDERISTIYLKEQLVNSTLAFGL